MQSPWKEPIEPVTPNLAMLSLSGIDQVREMVSRGRIPVPPIGRLTGMRPTEFGDGTSTFTMPETPWLLSPQGLVPIGVLAILADGPLGCSIQSILPPETPYTTAELSLTSARPVRPTGELMIGRGRVIHPGRRMALSDASIHDQSGRMIAHGTSRCMILPKIHGLPSADTLQPMPRHDDSGDPWRREPMGEVIPQEVWDEFGGLEVMRRIIEGDLPAPPISELTGMRATEVDSGTATFVLPATAWLCPPTAMVEGGFIAMVADAALQTAITSLVPAKTAMASVGLKVNYLRPAPPDGRDLIARGSVVHAGRSLIIANAEVTNAEGKAIAIATGSAMLLPGRSASLGDVPED